MKTSLDKAIVCVLGLGYVVFSLKTRRGNSVF